MSERKYSIEQDLREAGAMVEGLDRYIKGDQLYGTTGSGGASVSRTASVTNWYL